MIKKNQAELLNKPSTTNVNSNAQTSITTNPDQEKKSDALKQKIQMLRKKEDKK